MTGLPFQRHAATSFLIFSIFNIPAALAQVTNPIQAATPSNSSSTTGTPARPAVQCSELSLAWSGGILQYNITLWLTDHGAGQNVSLESIVRAQPSPPLPWTGNMHSSAFRLRPFSRAG
jgi:hypothetical protein